MSTGELQVTNGASLGTGPCNDNHASNLAVLDESVFRRQLEAAVTSSTPLILTGRHVTLTDRALRILNHRHLEIIGGTIAGDIHSLFQLDGTSQLNPRRLTLRHVTLDHTKQDEDPRQIGAAIFAMGTSVVVLDHCIVSSKGGFAVWAKHDAQISLAHCALHDIARTAVACFNQARVQVTNTTMTRVGIHGVCGRGTSEMTLNKVLLDHCEKRAVMVYQGATVTMEDCTIRNTQDPTTPTVHAQGPSLLENDTKNNVSHDHDQSQHHRQHQQEEEHIQQEPATPTSTSINTTANNKLANTKRTKIKKGNKTPNHIKVPKPDPTLLEPTLIMVRCHLEDNNQGTLIELEGRVHHNQLYEENTIS